ncbi:MAG: PAS domain S-box protein [Thermoplasmata archaeon]|nr:MAG: PAS domain S-box protein [Thermoplasmata archaeon]
MTEFGELEKEQTESEPVINDLPIKGIICIEEDGVILDLHYDAVKILGHDTPASIQDRPIFEYVILEDLDDLRREIEVAMQMNTTRSAYVSLKWPDKKILRTEVSITPWLNDPGKKQIVIFLKVINLVNDVSESNAENEDNIKKKELEHKNLWMFTINKNGVCQSWNEYCHRFFGYTKEAVISKKSIFDFIDNNNGDNLDGVIKNALSSEKEFNADVKFSSGNGSKTVKWGNITIMKGLENVDENGSFVCIFSPLEKEEDDNSVNPLSDKLKKALEGVSDADKIPMAHQLGETTSHDKPLMPLDSPAAVENTETFAHCMGYNDIAIVTSDGGIKYMTDNFVNQLGYSSFDEVRDFKWFELLMEPPTQEIFKNVTQSGEFRYKYGTDGRDNGGKQFPNGSDLIRVPYKTKGGLVKELDLQIIPIADNNGRYTEAIWLLNPEEDDRRPAPPSPEHDFEPTEPELALLELNNDLVTINTIANTIEQSMDLNEIVRIVLNSIVGTIKVEYAGIYLIRDRKLKLEYSIGLPSDIEFEPTEYTPNIAELAAVTNDGFKSYIEAKTQSSWTIPIQSSGELFGFIALASANEMELTDMDLDLINTTAYQLAGAVARQTILDDYNNLKSEYTDIFNNTPDIYIVVDSRGMIRSCNRNTFNVLGQSLTDLYNKNLSKILKDKLGENKTVFESWFNNVLGKREKSGLEIEMVVNDGEKRLFKISALPATESSQKWGDGFRLILHDITDYKGTNVKLSKSFELMEKIFHSTNDVILYLDSDRRIVECNNSVKNTFGYEREELLNGKVNIIYANELLMERYFKKLNKLYKDDTPIKHEQVIRRSDGSMFIAAVRGYPVKSDDGQVTGVALCYTDITDRKKEEKELVEAKKESSFYINILSHDINNYNECALSYLELLKQSSLEEHQENFVEIIRDQIETSIRLSNNVQKLSLMKTEKSELATIDLNRVLHNTAHNILEKTFRSSNMGKLDLKFNYSDGIYGVKADILIEELFSNIFWNSVQHNSHEVKLLEIAISKPVEHSDDFWLVEITDNAFGIPDDKKGSIFNKPTYGKSLRNKSGLGMSIIKNLVDRYGGRVWIENRVQNDYKKGSVFKVLLKKGKLPVSSLVYGCGALC